MPPSSTLIATGASGADRTADRPRLRVSRSGRCGCVLPLEVPYRWARLKRTWMCGRGDRTARTEAVYSVDAKTSLPIGQRNLEVAWGIDRDVERQVARCTCSFVIRRGVPRHAEERSQRVPAIVNPRGIGIGYA